MASPLVIDLSHHNPEPVWEALKAIGVVGIIHKATEGTGFLDPTYRKRKAAAFAAGLCWSSYHFLKHGNIAAQMDWYLGQAGAAAGDRVVIDYEDQACTLDDLHQAVQHILDERPDLQITVYSGHLLKGQLGSKRDALLADHTSLWLAQYAPKPSWPTETYKFWSLWQYTDSASVAGISGKVDANKWNGPLDKLPGWFHQEEKIVEPEPTPAPQPEVAVVSINIDAPAGVEVKISVNGRASTVS